MYGSKEGQDAFVRKFIKETGSFLDIGCYAPEDGNNTIRLEAAGWRGLLLDHDKRMIEACKSRRKSPAVLFDCAAAKRDDWIKILSEHKIPPLVDYLSLDVDDANIDVVLNFPFDLYEFKVMTIETDVYSCGDRRKEPIRKVIDAMPEYFCILDDGMVANAIWEDWFINRKYLNTKHPGYKKRHWTDMISSISNMNGTGMML